MGSMPSGSRRYAARSLGHGLLRYVPRSARASLAVQCFSSAHGTIPHDANHNSLATARSACARLAGYPRLQRTQSLVRKRPPDPDHWVPVSKYDYVRRSAAGSGSHCEGQSVCFLFSRGHQWDDAKHPGHKQHAIESYAHRHRDLRSRNRKGDRQHPERELRLLGLHQRRNQPCSCLDCYLDIKFSRKTLTNYFSRHSDRPPARRVS
jgi:hypothetical protein